MGDGGLERAAASRAMDLAVGVLLTTRGGVISAAQPTRTAHFDFPLPYLRIQPLSLPPFCGSQCRAQLETPQFRPDAKQSQFCSSSTPLAPTSQSLAADTPFPFFCFPPRVAAAGRTRPRLVALRLRACLDPATRALHCTRSGTHVTCHRICAVPHRALVTRCGRVMTRLSGRAVLALLAAVLATCAPVLATQGAPRCTCIV